MRPVVALAVGLALAATVAPATGQDENLEQLRLQQLHVDFFNACRPMAVHALVANDAAEIGLSQDALRIATERRLRAAGLFTDDNDESLGAFFYVHVSVVGSAFSATIAYHKLVVDLFNFFGIARIWSRGVTGTHGGDAD